jgi:hypothetical protein
VCTIEGSFVSCLPRLGTNLESTKAGVLGANLNNALVVAEADHANRDAEPSRDRRSVNAELDQDREGRRARERHGMLAVHPNPTVAVIHGTGVRTSRVLADRTVETTTRTSEHDRTDVHSGLREVPGQHAVRHDVLQGRNRSSRIVERKVDRTSQTGARSARHDLSSHAVHIIRLAVRDATRFLEVGFRLGQTNREPLTLPAERSREDAVRAVRERRAGREREGRVQRDLTEPEKVRGLRGGDTRNGARTGRNERIHGSSFWKLF